MAEDIGKRLLEMKQKIDDTKIYRAEIRGRIDQNLERLKKDFHVSSLKSAKRAAKVIAEEREEIKDKLDKIVDKLEESYEW